MRLPCRRWLLLTAGLIAVAVVMAVVLWPSSGPRPTRETVNRVRPGMTREQVYGTVGPPTLTSPGYHATPHEMWEGRDALLGIRFNENGRVIYMIVTNPPDPAARRR